ncbi:MAG: DUF2249 domain-containing protein [Niabella sp.]
MEFNSHTKIAEIIQFNKNSIDAIASIAPPLKRLKNPILRKIMAGRVTVAEASKMGGCQITDFVKVLQPLGYVFKETNDLVQTTEAENKKPAWLEKAQEKDIILFDVRSIIENGTDPLKEILHQFKEVPSGKILCIINTFVPTPLIHLLEKEKAEASFVETINAQLYHTYFLKKSKIDAGANTNFDSKVNMDDAQTFEAACNVYTEDSIKTIDVREMEMPLPMQTILAALEVLPTGHALFVHHKRVPVYLLEELSDKNYEIHIHTIEDGNIKMLIHT